MSKYCALLSGPTIAHDEKLKNELEEFAVVLSSCDNRQIESILNDNKVDLIILEIPNANLQEIEVIKIVKTRFPDTEIILVDGNGDQELIAHAFAFGVKDAFRKPYKTSLIVERANAFMRLT
ncbi:MAG: hypothetical protein ILNGONEN_02004 [Syntrophorhabdaceae bacterium]|nr:hypothetical protein [Syntrophorhabdaceae bacterium]